MTDKPQAKLEQAANELDQLFRQRHNRNDVIAVLRAYFAPSPASASPEPRAEPDSAPTPAQLFPGSLGAAAGSGAEPSAEPASLADLLVPYSALSRILHELAGSASLCWEPRPTGVFDSSQAITFVEQALAECRDAAFVEFGHGTGPRAEPADDLVAQIKDDIRSGEVGPNILCRQIDKLGAALRQARAERDEAKRQAAHPTEQDWRDTMNKLVATVDDLRRTKMREAELRAALRNCMTDLRACEYFTAYTYDLPPTQQEAINMRDRLEEINRISIAARAADKGEA